MGAMEFAYHRTMTRRKAWAIPVLITVALTATACSKATGYTTGSGSQAGGAYGNQATSTAAGGMSGAVQTAALKVERTKAGMVLAGGKGLTLYYYTEDKPGSGKSVCTGACAQAWPPLTAPVKAPAGAKMPGPLGMITRPGGVKQVTLNGFPIYYYAEDKAPGQAAGNGAEGAWHVIKIRTSAATTRRVSVLKAERTKAGTVLAGGKGLTLYYYTADKPGSGKSVCTGTCAQAWPPLTAPVKAPAGAKMPGPIAMITRADGVKQVTLNGYPLYYYAGDKAPGQATGNGVGGTWHVIKLKMKPGSTGGTAMPKATPTTNTGGGGGYGY
jgi:predicted lipoprotein with Yx(FWY)xxD motif